MQKKKPCHSQAESDVQTPYKEPLEEHQQSTDTVTTFLNMQKSMASGAKAGPRSTRVNGLNDTAKVLTKIVGGQPRSSRNYRQCHPLAQRLPY
jgi:hypothetical protein